MENRITIKIYKKDHEIIDNFLERAWDIQNSPYYKNKHRKFSFNFLEGKTHLKVIGPENYDLSAIIGYVRPFLLQQEPIYINSVIKKLINITKQIKNQEYERLLNNYKENYKTILDKYPVNLKINNQEFSPKDLMDLFIYGKYAKNDIERNKTIKQMGDFEKAFKFFFIDIIDNIIQLILRTAQIYYKIKQEYKIETFSNLNYIKQN